jgi:hypothetical protein
VTATCWSTVKALRNWKKWEVKMFEIVKRSNSELPWGETAQNARLEDTFAAPLPQKLFLPKRPGEPPFAPQQYYYPASKSGVFPCMSLPAAELSAHGDLRREAA